MRPPRLFCVFPPAVHALECTDFWEWLHSSCTRLADTYEQGDNEPLVSGYAWDIPATWTPERRAELNSNARGLGLGRTVEDPDGDSHTVFYLGFLDSHKNWESNLGYAWSTCWGSRESVQVGLGYTAMIVQRPDIADGWPFPAVLPLASVRYQQATLVTTYIPALGGGINHGSTLHVFGRFSLK